MPYYLKVDIEGADMLCVSALGLAQGQTSVRFGRVDQDLFGESPQEFDVLESLGYRRFQVVNQARIEEQSEPNPPREGAYADHNPRFGSSGLFGNDLPGRWLTKAQAIRKYPPLFLKVQVLWGQHQRPTASSGASRKSINAWSSRIGMTLTRPFEGNI